MKDNLALYRKYRPGAFKEVKGQEHITSVLEQSIKDSGTAHAYLFSGTRGLGKTSVARLLASAIGTSENDIYEIDAASNRGIDDIRELRENVRTLPFESEYKVYIIDEVHMLTKEAFNALLKTLEEPPAHAIFVLATTEIHKLPETVVSRCEVHYFKKPSTQILQEHVLDIAKKEGYTLDSAGAELIALLGDGSFRDTLGVTQKVLRGVNGKKVTIDDVEKITGAPQGALVNEVLSAIHEMDLNKGLSATNKVAEQNIDMAVFLKLLLYKVRAVLLLRHAKDMEKGIEADLPEDDFLLLKDFAVEKDSGIKAVALKSLLEASMSAGRAAVPQLPLELALMEIIGNNT